MNYKILPLFLPHKGCPYRCVFCDQKTITGHSSLISVKDIEKMILSFSSIPRDEDVRKEIAFYGGSFTALPEKLQRSLLKPAHQALKDDKIDGIRLSTRPDCCGHPALELLKAYEVQTVELGVQSMDTKVLLMSERGHGSEESEKAAKRLKDLGFITGIQLMPGLPGEDTASFLYTIERVISLRPDFVRLYPTIVIKGTGLEELYQQGIYIPLTLQQAIDICSVAIKMLRDSGISVIRCGLQPSPSLQKKGSIIDGPFHPAFGELVESAVILGKIKDSIDSLSLRSTIHIKSSPRFFSIIKGHKGSNEKHLQALFPEQKFLFHADPLIPDSFIRLKADNGRWLDIPVDIF